MTFNKSRQMTIFWEIYCFERTKPINVFKLTTTPPLDVSYARWAAIVKFFKNNFDDCP